MTLYIHNMDQQDVVTELRSVSPVVAHAMDFAEMAHAGQSRKFRQSGELVNLDYSFHPFRVALRLHTWFGDEELTVAGVLHDTVEDGADNIMDSYGGPAQNVVEKMFGQRVAEAVDHVTNKAGQDYRTHVVHIATTSLDALAVKSADLVDNAGGIRETVTTEQRRKKLSGKYLPVVQDLVDLATTRAGEVDAVVAPDLQSMIPGLQDLSR